jgi:galactokinase
MFGGSRVNNTTAGAGKTAETLIANARVARAIELMSDREITYRREEMAKLWRKLQRLEQAFRTMDRVMDEVRQKARSQSGWR